MDEIRKQAKALIDELKGEKYAEYKGDWQSRAVAVINEYHLENSDGVEMIMATDSDEWDAYFEQQAKDGGWLRMKFFLGCLDTTADWVSVDVYGNAHTADHDILPELLDIAEGRE